MVAEFQTPLLRVSRPVAACSRCRSAKIKCDGKLPVSPPPNEIFLVIQVDTASLVLLAREPASKLNVQVLTINLLGAKSAVMYRLWRHESRSSSVGSEKLNSENHLSLQSMRIMQVPRIQTRHEIMRQLPPIPKRPRGERLLMSMTWLPTLAIFL